jgi:shikimate dehydrogenase
MNDLFDFRPPMRDFAVMGNPVAHSKSPLIHGLFADQCGIRLNYTRIQVDPGGFDQAVSHFSAHGGAGLNITVPFKVEAWELCRRSGNSLSDRARTARSVNTLHFSSDQGVIGDNTDGVGMIRDIEHNLGYPVAGRRVLIIGAGGAVRGVLGPLLACRPASVLVVNRTASRAEALVANYDAEQGTRLTAGSLGSVNEAYDLVINGTAASLDQALPDVSSACFKPDTLAYDMMYGSEPTCFMKWALDNAAGSASDGLGMLVEQAAESFFLWHDVRPDTKPVISHLRKV